MSWRVGVLLVVAMHVGTYLFFCLSISEWAPKFIDLDKFTWMSEIKGILMWSQSQHLTFSRLLSLASSASCDLRVRLQLLRMTNINPMTSYQLQARVRACKSFTEVLSFSCITYLIRMLCMMCTAALPPIPSSMYDFRLPTCKIPASKYLHVYEKFLHYWYIDKVSYNTWRSSEYDSPLSIGTLGLRKPPRMKTSNFQYFRMQINPYTYILCRFRR